MSACPDKEMLLHGLLDAELDAANAQAAEAHLKSCPGCAEAYRDLQALRTRIADPQVAYHAPDALRARIEAMAAAEPARPRRLRAAAPWALSGTFAALAATFAVMAVQPTMTLALEDELVASHVRSTLASHLVDVETSDRHTVKPWFNGKVDFAPPVVDLASEGFPLAGGRLDYLDNRVVAALVYRRNKHVVNLFVWPAEPGRKLPARAEPHAGYAVVHWTDRGLQFWAVSDIDPRDLEAFHQAFAKATHS
ncbi:MAG: anti-sigma factor family protein [Phenylobacterium sp.]